MLRGENLGRQALVEKFDELTRRLSHGDTAFFFFAGHGVSIRGGNYILPTDVPNVQSGQETLLARTSLGENDIVSDLQGRGVRVAVVVLDACRNNPFKRRGTQAIGGERGCVRSDPVQGVFSIYSAGIGQAALDRLDDADTNPNSVFTRVLVPALGRPGLDLGGLAVEVREEVARLAGTIGHIQRPAYYDETIGGRIYLAGLPSAGTVTTPPSFPPRAVKTTTIRPDSDPLQLAAPASQPKISDRAPAQPDTAQPANSSNPWQLMLMVNARFGKEPPNISGGLQWRIYLDKPDANGVFRMVREERAAAPFVLLPPGDYVVHVSFGTHHRGQEGAVALRESARDFRALGRRRRDAVGCRARRASCRPQPSRASLGRHQGHHHNRRVGRVRPALWRQPLCHAGPRADRGAEEEPSRRADDGAAGARRAFSSARRARRELHAAAEEHRQGQRARCLERARDHGEEGRGRPLGAVDARRQA